MTDVADDTTQLQNAVGSFLSAMKPDESVAFASLVYFYNGRHDVRYNGCIFCARVAPALKIIQDRISAVVYLRGYIS
jgi:hypothetical protein